jgi:hypothetical protein
VPVGQWVDLSQVITTWEFRGEYTFANDRLQRLPRIEAAGRLGISGAEGCTSPDVLCGLGLAAGGCTSRRSTAMGWNRPKLTFTQILRWADSHHRGTGQWPETSSGGVKDNLNETWRRIDHALCLGLRGLPGGSSLARFLNEKRGVRKKQNLPRLTEEQILAWADSRRERTGRWLRVAAGPVAKDPDEDWRNINMALLHPMADR